MTSRWLAKTVLVMVATTATLLAVEVALRFKAHLQNRGVLTRALETGIEIPADRQATLIHLIRRSDNPKIIYRLRPDLDVVFQGQRCQTDARGFRSTGVDPDGGGELKIVGLGDSVMFGWGVGDDETYLARLAAMIDRTHGPAGCEITNTAVPGYNTVMEVETLATWVADLQPDLVVIGWVGNDLSLPNFISSPRDVLTFRKLYLRDFIRSATAPLRQVSIYSRLELAGLETVPVWEPDGVGRTIDPDAVPEAHRELVGWDAHDAALATLAELGRRHGFEAIWLSVAPALNPRTRRAIGIARGHGFHVVDMSSPFNDYVRAHADPSAARSLLTLSEDDPHPSVAAHELIASTLYETVASMHPSTVER